MSRGGSCDRTAEVAARALLEMGFTRLQVLIGSHVAAFGGACWKTDNGLRAEIGDAGGRLYHRESIGRARRVLARAGVLRVKRIFTGQKPIPKAAPSAHGTTVKRIAWDKLGQADPTVRRDAAIARNVAAKQKRAELAKQIEHAGRAKYSTPIPNAPNYATRTPDVDPDLAKLFATYERKQYGRELSANERAGDVTLNVTPERPPD